MVAPGGHSMGVLTQGGLANCCFWGGGVALSWGAPFIGYANVNTGDTIQ